jgi:hypothetical protein
MPDLTRYHIRPGISGRLRFVLSHSKVATKKTSQIGTFVGSRSMTRYIEFFVVTSYEYILEISSWVHF